MLLVGKRLVTVTGKRTAVNRTTLHAIVTLTHTQVMKRDQALLQVNAIHPYTIIKYQPGGNPIKVTQISAHVASTQRHPEDNTRNLHGSPPPSSRKTVTRRFIPPMISHKYSGAEFNIPSAQHANQVEIPGRGGLARPARKKNEGG